MECPVPHTSLSRSAIFQLISYRSIEQPTVCVFPSEKCHIKFLGKNLLFHFTTDQCCPHTMHSITIIHISEHKAEIPYILSTVAHWDSSLLRCEKKMKEKRNKERSY